MIDRMISTDKDGEEAFELRHTVSGEIVFFRYGVRSAGLGYEEANTLHRMLGAMLSEIQEAQ